MVFTFLTDNNLWKHCHQVIKKPTFGTRKLMITCDERGVEESLKIGLQVKNE